MDRQSLIQQNFTAEELEEEKEIFKIDSEDDSYFDGDSYDNHEWFDSDYLNIPESENEF